MTQTQTKPKNAAAARRVRSRGVSQVPGLARAVSLFLECGVSRSKAVELGRRAVAGSRLSLARRLALRDELVKELRKHRKHDVAWRRRPRAIDGALAGA